MAFGFRLLVSLQKTVCIVFFWRRTPRLSNHSSEVRRVQIVPPVPGMPRADTVDPEHGEPQQLSPLTLVSRQALQKTGDQPCTLQQTRAKRRACVSPLRVSKSLYPSPSRASSWGL